MSATDTNPYHPPDPEPPTSTATETSGSESGIGLSEPMPSAGRRLTSTVICTGGMIWFLMSLAVVMEILLRASDGGGEDQRRELFVSILFATIGAAIFNLGVFIRRDQPRRTFFMMLLILGLFVLFPLIAIANK